MSAPAAAPQTYDIIIIGAGTAGCVLAARLSEDGARRVLLIEAGGPADDPRIADPAAWPLLQGSDVDWAYRTTPQPGLGGRIEECPRGRVIGGSSAINAMGHMRGHPGDFDGWGVPGWAHADLLPYFQRSEAGPLHLEQPGAPHPLSAAHVAAGVHLGLPRLADHNSGPMAGATFNAMVIRDGKRQSVAEAYLTDVVRARPNLEIRASALVDRIIFDGARATGVMLRSETVHARGAVILAAGSIGSPLIAMRSGLGPAELLHSAGIMLRSNLPGVGQNLQDHLLSGGNVWRSLQPVPLTGTQHSEAMMYIPAASADPAAPPDLVVGVTSAPLVSAGLAGLADAPEMGAGYTLMFGITHPRSRGHLAITSADPNAAPLIDPGYLSDPIDAAHFREALAWARRLARAPSYMPWRGEEVFPRAEDMASEAAQDAFIARAALTHHHPIGTLRMGCEAGAPVTPALQMRGTQGLFVVDGSVMPMLTTGPVNAAIIAIAERGAELIRATL